MSFLFLIRVTVLFSFLFRFRFSNNFRITFSLHLTEIHNFRFSFYLSYLIYHWYIVFHCLLNCVVYRTIFHMQCPLVESRGFDFPRFFHQFLRCTVLQQNHQFYRVRRRSVRHLHIFSVKNSHKLCK